MLNTILKYQNITAKTGRGSHILALVCDDGDIAALIFLIFHLASLFVSADIVISFYVNFLPEVEKCISGGSRNFKTGGRGPGAVELLGCGDVLIPLHINLFIVIRVSLHIYNSVGFYIVFNIHL